MKEFFDIIKDVVVGLVTCMGAICVGACLLRIVPSIIG